MTSLRAQFSGEAEPAPANDAPVVAETHTIDDTAKPAAAAPRAEDESAKGSLGIVAFAAIMSAFWAGAACAYARSGMTLACTPLTSTGCSGRSRAQPTQSTESTAKN